MPGIVSIDTEATGVDRYHGTRPFLFTSCDQQWNNTFFEWDVDPLTRKVTIPHEDKVQIVGIIKRATRLVFQNGKFDIGLLLHPEVLGEELPEWPWDKTHDTLFGGHLLASNHQKDLNTQAIEYLGVDITKYEMAVKAAVQYIHKEIKHKNSPIGRWCAAKSGMEDSPSIKDGASKWKADMWMPRAFMQWVTDNDPDNKDGFLPEGYEGPLSEHPWWTVTQEYANTDSSVGLALHLKQMEMIKERDLVEIYNERLKLLPVVSKIENYGVTISGARTDKIHKEFSEESERLGNICKNIAKGYDDFDLVLPKSGVNNSLRELVFDKMQLPPVKIGKKKKTEKPGLDKYVMQHYEETLPERSKSRLFITSLKNKRKRDTAISYAESYRRFWIPLAAEWLGIEPERLEDWYVLHPWLNPTGTDTLRMSSQNPNEQNISKQEGFSLRWAFGPAPGREWWSLDAQNIELRIPAYEANEPDMVALFEKPNDPPYYGSNHLLNFHTVYPDIWDKGVKEVGLELVGRWCKKSQSIWHQRCKNGGFAVQYGAMDRPDGSGTADRAFARAGSHAKLRQRFARIHGPDGLNQQMIQHAERYGYVETIPDKSIGAKRGYPLLCTRSEWGKILPTVPLNYHVQGTACWWMCKAMVRVQKQLDDWAEQDGFKAYIVMQVHDELVIDMPAGSGGEFAYRDNLPRIRRIVDLMKMGGDDIDVPTAVNCEYHPDNWADGTAIYLAKEPV